MAERKTPDNLFQRLTKLFRSGPSIKRKVKNYSKGDKNASSAVELFKKSHSDDFCENVVILTTFCMNKLSFRRRFFFEKTVICYGLFVKKL